MKKYAQGEGDLEVFRGPEAEVVNRHISKTGKTVADFDATELDAFRSELDALRIPEGEKGSPDAPVAAAKPKAKSEE